MKSGSLSETDWSDYVWGHVQKEMRDIPTLPYGRGRQPQLGSSGKQFLFVGTGPGIPGEGLKATLNRMGSL